MIIFAFLVAVLPWIVRRPNLRLVTLAYKPLETREIGPEVPITVILELLVAALQTGAAIPRALRTVGGAVAGSTGPTLVRAGRQLELGATWDQAWRALSGELNTVADALRPAWEMGASPTASLRAAAEGVHRRQLEASRLAAARLTVRLVLPLGLCLLPAFVLIGLVPVLLSLGSALF